MREGADAFHAGLDAISGRAAGRREDPPRPPRPPARRRGAARRRDRVRPRVALPRGRAARGDRRPSGAATRSGSARSSARAATAASCAPTWTRAPPRCSRSRRRTGPTPGSCPAATPTSSPTASTRSSSTGSAGTRPVEARARARALIVNPYASRVTRGARSPSVERVLEPVETLRTERAGHATELAREADGRRDRRLLRRRRLQRGAERRPAGCAVGFVPGGGTSVLPRALGLPRDPLAAARRIAAGRHAPDLARPRERPPLRLQRRARARRGARSAGSTRAGATRAGSRPGDLVFAWTAVRSARGAPLPLRAGARDRRPRPRPRSRSSPTAIPTRTPGPMPLRLHARGALRGRARRGGAARVTRADLAPALCRVRRSRPRPDRARDVTVRPRPRPDRRSLRRAAAAPGRRRGSRRRDRGRVRGGAGRGRRCFCSLDQPG